MKTDCPCCEREVEIHNPEVDYLRGGIVGTLVIHRESENGESLECNGSGIWVRVRTSEN